MKNETDNEVYSVFRHLLTFDSEYNLKDPNIGSSEESPFIYVETSLDFPWKEYLAYYHFKIDWLVLKEYWDTFLPTRIKGEVVFNYVLDSSLIHRIEEHKKVRLRASVDLVWNRKHLIYSTHEYRIRHEISCWLLKAKAIMDWYWK